MSSRSPLGGLLFVAAFLVTFLSPAVEDTEPATATELIALAEKNSAWIDVSLVLALLSLIFLGWFVAGLHVRKRRLSAGMESTLALVGGVAFTLLFFAALTTWQAPMSELSDETGAAQRAAADAYFAIEDIGWILLGGAGVGAGVMIITASLTALRSGSVPPWAGGLGIAFGVAALATVIFFGIFAWLAWIAIVSTGMLVRGFRSVPQGSTGRDSM